MAVRKIITYSVGDMERALLPIKLQGMHTLVSLIETGQDTGHGVNATGTLAGETDDIGGRPKTHPGSNTDLG